jgi:putative transposase
VAYLPGNHTNIRSWQSGEGTPMTKVAKDEAGREGIDATLDALAREGARRMILAALEAEVEGYVERLRGERCEDGRAAVVRNGRGRPRQVTLGSGTVTIEAPRVNDKRVVEGERQKFTSKLLPPYMRRSQNVSELLPLLYLRGLSTGDFREALPTLLGENASGLSPSAITRLVSSWAEERQVWRKRSLSDRDYVYVWADGVHFNVRLDDERVAVLVVMGARLDGTKEIVAIDDGFRESKESWLSVLRDLRDRGMQAPVLAVGDGALGFWGALSEVFPATREQRCWVHKLANVLDKVPKSLQPKVKSSLHEVMNAPTRKDALKAIKSFVSDFGAKYPKAADCLTKDQDVLLTFYDFPAEHWKHLRTTNPIESSFATVRLRTRVTKGPGSRSAGLAMVFMLLLTAQKTWRKLNGQELVPLVRAGVKFVDGVRVEREIDAAPARPETAKRRAPTKKVHDGKVAA